MPTITPPTIAQRILRALNYLCIGGAGAWSAFIQPTFMHGPLGQILALAWCLCLLSAVPTAIYALLGRYRGEFVIVPFFLFAVAVLAGYMWVIVPTNPNIAPHAFLLSALTCSIGTRYAGLHRLLGLRIGGGEWTGSR